MGSVIQKQMHTPILIVLTTVVHMLYTSYKGSFDYKLQVSKIDLILKMIHTV